MWLKRLLHLVAYTIGILMVISTCLSQLPLYEQIFRIGIVLYLSIIYIEFVDGSMLSRIKPSVLFNEDEKRQGMDDIDNLIQASRMSLHWLRLVQQSETPAEREHSIDRFEQHIEFIQQMNLPKRYRKDQRDILRDAQSALLSLTQ